MGVTLSTTFSERRSTDRIASFPVVTPEVEQAFPERFTRGLDGRLIEIDQRPINIAEAETSELRSGIDVRLRRPATSGSARNIDFSIYHTWRLRDQITISPDLPVLDFLGGSVAETATVRPRHHLSLQAGIYQSGIGARVSGTWQNAARLMRADGDDLTFSSLTVLNFRLFADLAEFGTARLLQGARITLDVNNVFNTRQQVRSAQGETPFIYDPAFMDPLGREIKITLRKQF
jgi:outer membrane receptor protein involved in Fe transport